MANPKDESAKGSARPGEPSAGKRPYATLDLQATEVGGASSASGAGTEDSKATEPPRAGVADSMRATAARIGALKAYAPSGSFLSHLAAGTVGALIVALSGYLLLPAPDLDPRQAIALRQLAARLADAEAVLGVQPGDTSGLVARTEELARTVRTLGDAQAQLTAETKSLATKNGTGEKLPPDLAARLAKLEQALTAPSGEGGETSKAVLATLDRELASIRTEAARLSQRIDTLKGDLDERMRSVVRSSDIAPLQAKLAWLEKELQVFIKSEGERSANSARVLLSLELANLKRVMDRGEPFTAELASVKRAAGDTLDVKLLERYMREGVPTTADIAKSFHKVANAMLDAEAEPPGASIVDRLISGAKSIVRVRKAGHSADDTSPEATVARMETALKEGRLAEVLEQGKRLPPKAALVAEDWLRQVEARYAVDRAMSDIEGTLKSSFVGALPVGKEQRR